MPRSPAAAREEEAGPTLRIDEPAVGKKGEAVPRPKRMEHIPGQIIVREGAGAGVPCLSVPMGFGPNGLPLGLSMTGNLFGEKTIPQIGMIEQRETDWHTMKPAVDRLN